MGCQIHYKKGKVDKVLAPNGEPSTLFKGIGKEFGTTPGYSLRLWAQTYTPSFKSIYEGGYDKNGEAQLSDAKNLLHGFADEVRLSQDFDSSLRKVSEMYEIGQDGFFPRVTEVSRLRSSLKKHGLYSVSIKHTPTGSAFLSIGGAFYNPMTQHYYQSPNEGALRDFRIVQALEKLMSDLGVSVEWTDRLSEDIVGRADVTNRLIELAEDRAGIKDVTEEMLHVAVAMMRGTPTYAAMMSNITETAAYAEVQEEYIGLENYNDRKLKEEAVVKHLRDMLLANENLTWWESLLNWLRKVFNNPQAISAFRKVTDSILKQDVGALNMSYSNTQNFDWRSERHLDDVWYSITPNAARQQTRIDHLDRLDVMDTQTKENDRYVLTIDGKKKVVSMRVSDILQKYARGLYGRGEWDKTSKKLLTTKGTIVHKYNQILMEHFMLQDPKKLSAPKKQIEDAVYASLKNDPDMKEFDKNYFMLNLVHFHELADGIGHLYKSIKDQDTNAIVRTEQFIYDPNRPQGDIGGSIDVLVVHGDGTMSLFDYKGVRLHRDVHTGFLPVDDRKLQLWDIQIGEYKKILMDTMGLSRHDFRQTRVIPINTQFRNGAFYKIQMSRAGLSKSELDENGAAWRKSYIAADYTRFAAVSGERVPGDTELNVFLEKLYIRRDNLRAQMRKARGPERTRVKRQLDRINNMANEILVYQDLQQPLESLKLMIHSIQNNITQFSSGQIMNSLGAVTLFESFQSAFAETLSNMKDLKKKEKYTEFIKKYNGLLVQAKSSLQQEIINRASIYTGDQYDTPINEKRILKGGKQKDVLGSLWEGAGTFNEPVLRTIMKLITEAEEKARLIAFSYEARINQTTESYLKWARGEGHGSIDGIKSFAPLIDKKTGNLVRTYTQEFYETRKEMRKAGLEKQRNKGDYSKELKWLQDHVEFDEKAWQKDYDTKSEEAKISGISKEELKRELSMLKAMNPKFSNLAYFQQRNKFLKSPKVDTDPKMSRYVSDEYKYIRQHKPALEYYNMYRDITGDMAEVAGYDLIQSDQVANIYATTVEHFGKMGTMGGADFQAALRVREHDHLFGAIDQETGKPMRRIPILHLDKIIRNLSAKEEAEVKKEILDEGIKEQTGEFNDEFERRKRRKMEEKGVNDKSTDLSSSLKTWVTSVMDYKFKSEIEDDILLIRQVLESPLYKERPSDKFGRDIVNLYERMAQETQGASEKTKSIVDKFINAHLYGQKVQGGDYLIGGVYSITKGVRTMHSYLSAKALGLNPILAGASAMNAMYNRSIMAKREIYFSEQSFKDALKTAFKSTPKAIMAVLFFEPADKARDRALRSSASKRKVILSGRNLFSLHRGIINKWSGGGQKELKEAGQLTVDDPLFGDDAVANKILLAMMNWWVIDSDGKVRSKGDPFHPPKDPNAKTIWEAFEEGKVLEEDGFNPENLPIKGLSFEEYNRFRRLVLEAQTKVKGTQTTDSYNTVSMTILGQAFMKFRTWMPGLVANRFEALRYNPLLESYSEGYFRGGVREVMPSLSYIRSTQEAHATLIGTTFEMIKESMRGGLKVLGEALTMGVYSYKVNEERAAYFRNKLLEKNPDIDPAVFTLEAFIDYRTKSAKAFIKEVRIYAGLIAMVTLVLGAMGWDDEDEGNLATRLTYKLAQRTLLEISFFFSLKSVTEIVDSPFASYRLIKSMTQLLDNMTQESARAVGLLDPSKYDRTPMGYYTLKHIPVANQVASLAGIFPAYTGRRGTLEQIFDESKFFERQGMARR